jgi:hypothetical protein
MGYDANQPKVRTTSKKAYVAEFQTEKINEGEGYG